MRVIYYNAAALLALMSGAGDASAQTLDLRALLPDGQGAASGRIMQMLMLITVLSVAPGLLITLTCFTRFVIAFSFLRSGLGLTSAPSSSVLISLALFMTLFVMAPVFDRMWTTGLQPLLENKIDESEAYKRISAPLKEFMQANTREKDIRLFEDLANRKQPTGSAEGSSELRILVPAFLISELRRGFEIGFLIILPFLVIDLIVATLVMSMGMMMLQPATISLPCKVLFFVLIDGWNLLTGSLVRSVL